MLRRALEVESLRHVGLVERVVGDRDLLVEDPLSDPAAEVAALFEEALGAERVVREPAQQLGDGVRLEHGGVMPRLDLDGAASPCALRGSLLGSRGGIDVRHPPVGLLRPAGSAFDGRQTQRVRVGERLICDEPRGGCESDLGHPAREVPVELEVSGRLDRDPGEPCLVLGAERGRLLVEADERRILAGRSEPREVRIGLHLVGGLRGSLREVGQAVGPVRRGPADAPVTDDAEADDRVVDQRRLVDDGAGKAGDARALRVDERLGFVALGRAESAPLRDPTPGSTRDPYLDVAEARRRGAVRDVGFLAGLALAAVG